MKLIIDIPEEVKQTFDNAKDDDLYGNYYDRNSLIGKAIQNGTPIPDNASVCDIEQISSARYNNGFYDGKKAMEEKIEQIRAEIERLHYHPKLDFIKNDEVVDMALDIIDKYTKGE